MTTEEYMIERYNDIHKEIEICIEMYEYVTDEDGVKILDDLKRTLNKELLDIIL